MTWLIISIFVIGYLAIALEHFIHLNKAASAMITGVLCWTVYILNADDLHHVNEQLIEHLGEISGILFFLLGAMTIVELIDAHDGFQIISDRIKTTDKRKLLWIVGILSFFLSAALDNLTTTIVMISLITKLVDSRENRLFFAGVIVIAANAGGAWSPIGDVTTTMLWIGGQITVSGIIMHVLIPSIVCLIVPLFFIGRILKGKVKRPEADKNLAISDTTPANRNAVFIIGICCLLFVPIFKTFTHLPPFMGMLLGLGIMWVITEFIHHEKDEVDKDRLSVNYALRKIDTPSILFFLGILISVSALQSIGVLTNVAESLSSVINSENVIVMSIGLLSSIVDNVPLVAASQAMYSLEQYPIDHPFWQFMAYCTGTGGSALIIGSAAGVAAMGIEKIEFFWYVKKISLWALLGYFAGAVVFILQMKIFA
jgi:Na+/H+ antiporter NhaD/arsenite permease-like protein